MLEKLEISLRKLRRFAARGNWLVRLLGLSRLDNREGKRGLILIQIDALSRKQLERALDSNRMPFVSKLLKKEKYKKHFFYTGMPCDTPAVQAELFYGKKSTVPSFHFVDKKTNKIFVLKNPPAAKEMENRISEGCRGLFEGGSCYSNIYTGNALEPHFCISSLGLPSLFTRRQTLGFALAVVLHVFILARMGALLVIELALGIFSFFRGVLKGAGFLMELKFIPSRVAMCILLREMIYVGAKMDITRGLPIIHFDLMGYHEHSHRRGASSRFAHWTLKGIDYTIERLWGHMHRCGGREYDIWIYSDHGQADCKPFQKKAGKSISEKVSEIIYSKLDLQDEGTKFQRLRFLNRIGITKKHFKLLEREDKAGVTTTSLGPLAHIYLPEKREQQELIWLSQELLKKLDLTTAFLPTSNEGVVVVKQDKYFDIRENPCLVFNADFPAFDERLNDFITNCNHPNSGDIILSGYHEGNDEYYSFTDENGTHGGIKDEECEGFAILPGSINFNNSRKWIRPVDLRKAALDFLDNEDGSNNSSDSQIRTAESFKQENQLRIMTYNVHSCIGMDGKLSPSRIARVIEQYQPDVVALQELDVYRERTGNLNQVSSIAEILQMDHFFHPAMEIEQEKFGDAVLSRIPMKLVKSAGLPCLKKASPLEPRGALWVELDVGGIKVQLITTHLSLSGKERKLQIESLVGEEWCKHESFRRPAIVCGDFNMLPNSRLWKQLAANFNLPNCSGSSTRLKSMPTWGGRFPLLQLDHVFYTEGLSSFACQVADTHLARLASDHRPLIADFRL